MYLHSLVQLSFRNSDCPQAVQAVGYNKTLVNPYIRFIFGELTSFSSSSSTTTQAMAGELPCTPPRGNISENARGMSKYFL
jgi:hypothetical protein